MTTTHINDQAVKAALKKLAPSLKPEVIYPCMGGAMQEVGGALEAAMPHIRAQIAAETLRDAIESVEDAGFDAYTTNEVSIWLHERAQQLAEES